MLFDLNYRLNIGEKLVAVVRKHWYIIAPNFIEFAIIISLLIVFANKFIEHKESFIINLLLAVCFLVYCIYLWILLRVDYYIITSDRVIKIKHQGIWDRKVSEILIVDIANIILNEKGIAASLLKFGSIKISLRDSKVFKMSNIINPMKVYQGLIKLKEIKKT